MRADGQRMPPWERQLDKYLRAKPKPSRWTEAERVARLHEQIEPALDRELGQRGVLSGDGAYIAELVLFFSGFCHPGFRITAPAILRRSG